MKYQINVYKSGKNIILEQLTIDKNRTIKRRERDNEREIRTFLKDIMSNLKEIKKIYEDNENMKFIFKENLSLTVLNYNIVKDNQILDDVRKTIREFKLLEKKKKQKKSYATMFALSMAAVMSITSYQGKSNNEKSNIKVETESNQDLDNNITLLNKDLETVQIQQTEFRSQHYIEIQENLLNLANLFPEVGSKKNDEKKQNVENSYNKLTEKYAKLTGIDQEILECILAQERGFHSSIKDEGGAIGVAQIQVGAHIGETLYLKNEQTEQTESFIVTEDLLKDLEGNIKVSATLLQNKLKYYNGNTLIAIQAYNYGYGAMDKVLEDTAKETGKTKDEIINNPTNTIWLHYVEEYENGNYGDNHYLEHVLNFLDKEYFTAKYNKNEKDVIMTVKPDTLVIEKSQSR